MGTLKGVSGEGTVKVKGGGFGGILYGVSRWFWVREREGLRGSEGCGCFVSMKELVSVDGKERMVDEVDE